MSSVKRLVYAIAIAVFLFGCGGTIASTASTDPSAMANAGSPFEIRATAEITQLEDAGIFTDFTAKTGIPLNIHTERGSVEIAKNIQSITDANPSDVDAYITASPLWMPGSIIAGKTTIMTSVTAFPVDSDVAVKLGWQSGHLLSFVEISNAIAMKSLQICAPSAAQDDAAANFFLANLTALKGTGETLRVADLSNPSIILPMRSFYSGVVVGSNTSSNLIDRMFNDRKSKSAKCNAAVLPESAAIALDKKLSAEKLPTMTVFYVDGAIGFESYTFGYVSTISAEKQKQFAQLAAYLTSPEIQTRIKALGFRASTVGIMIHNADPAVFNPSWGILTQREFLLTELPKEPVIAKAIEVYQTQLRRGSFTVYCLDYSGSMRGSGKQDLLIAMDAILDQDKAISYKIQAAQEDTTVIIMFGTGDAPRLTIIGNDKKQLKGLFNSIANAPMLGDTNLGGCVLDGMDAIKKQAGPNQLAAVITLTDGGSNIGPDIRSTGTQNEIKAYGVPVFSIMVGAADKSQLDLLKDATSGQVCDGRGGIDALVRCFRDFKGSN
jgi:Ca-activated chloride channel family protein